jgi:hypothetical protein
VAIGSCARPVGLGEAGRPGIFFHFASFLIHLSLHSQLIQNLWNFIRIKINMYGTWCKALFIPEKLMDKVWFNGRQHTPKLKLLLVLEQGWNLGLGDQELRQCSPPAGTLCITYYSNSYVPWECWLVPWFGVWGLPAFRPSSWAVERLNSFHRSFPASCSGSYLGFFPQVFVRMD